MEQKFYICKHCGNIYAAVKQTKVPVMCCGAKMEEIIPGTVEASVEKHVPVYTVEGNTGYSSGYSSGGPWGCLRK